MLSSSFWISHFGLANFTKSSILKVISSHSINIFLKCNKYNRTKAVILTSFLQYFLSSSRCFLSQVSWYCFHKSSHLVPDSSVFCIHIRVSDNLFSHILFPDMFRINWNMSKLFLFIIPSSFSPNPHCFMLIGLSKAKLLNHIIYHSNSVRVLAKSFKLFISM
ncbi:MAG: hypothetical protein BWY04_00871 [candidate division CPR1 bacterium ADurb.Bin160]|uniref:Uncharacterized protein n=1 Tax=candidate division CPR1 bacterium ADurb.Bin160 TaxID=1852826 RepID=A0A1V5ZMC4_9BACT|nr:MAG: hypothetical protein BWY04_00871 [candidate division CPR1 bacterium ADurb.Bin160]